jgi:hypothetical protein
VGSTEIETIVKMIESMPESTQKRLVEHLREYIEELQDEAEWESIVEKTGPKLVDAARRARHQIAEGLSKPLDVNDL